MPLPDHRRFSDLLSDGVPRAWSSAANSDALRRRMYLWALVLGSALLIVVWLMQLGQVRPDLYVLVGHPLLLVQCLWVAWWLLRGQSLIVAERVVFVVNALAILVQLLLAMVSGAQELVGQTSAAYWMLVAFSILGFLIFSNRQALLFSATFYAVGVGLPWAVFLVRGTTLSVSSELIRVQLTCGVVLALLSVLAWYRGRFTVERGQRLSLEHLANTDPMTGLPNRRALYHEIERVLESVRQGGQGCLILLDVDHFKRVNDTYGHNVGDEVLIRVAALVRSHLRGGDTVGRWGGEEFLITLPGSPLEQAEHAAERLRQLIAEGEHGQGPSITASFGVTCCSPDDDLTSFTARTDRALYMAKTSGRNRVVALPVGSPESARQDIEKQPH